MVFKSGLGAIAVLLLSAVHQVSAHMEVKSPPPRRSKHNKAYPETQYDYSYTSPLGPEFPFPCRGYGKGPSSGDFAAGSSIPLLLNGEANHNGGHCQFALSYDDKTFAVLKTVFGTCMVDSMSYSVSIPANAPSGPATIAWGWINRSGNREYYMNCIDINITGGKTGGSVSGPQLYVANLPNYEIFPEGFANDYNKAKIEGMPIVTVSPSGSVPSPVEPQPEPQPKPQPEPQPKPTSPTEIPNPKPTYTTRPRCTKH